MPWLSIPRIEVSVKAFATDREASTCVPAAINAFDANSLI
jgi:hypothetical protein